MKSLPVKLIGLGLLAIGLFLFGLWLGIYLFADTDEFELADHPLYSSGLYDLDFFDRAYERADKADRAKNSSSAIVAHHLLVPNNIAQVMEATGRRNIKTVVVLSPNHFSVGHSPAQISYGNWQTPYGILENDSESVTRLLENVSFLTNEEVTFEEEHGVAALTPFIKKSFPKTKIVPVVVHEKLSLEQTEELGQVIAEQLPNSFVIASIDMSHYLPEYVSAFHDEVSEAVIARGGCESCELEVDSNAVLQTLWSINVERETQQWTRLYRGSAALSMQGLGYEDNTSHLIGYFSKGPPLEDSMISFTFLGDVMIGRYAGDTITAEGAEYPWKQITRFLSGTDYVVGNFEGTVCDQQDENPEEPPYEFSFSFDAVSVLADHIDVVSLANNHTDDFSGECLESTQQALDELEVQWFGEYNSPVPIVNLQNKDLSVALIGYNYFQSEQTELINTIEQASIEGKMVIVYPHWGIEYETSSYSAQQELAQAMIAAGADLIIGSHPHVVQEFETVDSRPVFYSLGNFIFDQDLPGTNQGFAVGLILSDKELKMYLMPYEIVKYQPTPISDKEAEIFFQENNFSKEITIDLYE